ncbi:MAG: SPFH domain-containing protein [Promethearchaeota archaeon]
MAEFQFGVAGIVLLVVGTIVLFALFVASRYVKFTTNEYVIHFRNGKILSQGRGGKIIKFPLVDEIVVIPTTTRKTMLNSNEKILSREFQDIRITALLYWKVADPGIAYNAVVWDPRSDDYVVLVLSTAAEAIIRTTCASLPVEKILCDRNEIIKLISDQLLNLTKDWGIIIESLEIVEARVLDSNLKENMEAVKQIDEKREARLADANAQEIYRLREIDVNRQAEVAEKEKATQVQRQEMVRQEIEAETYRKTTILRARADADAMKMKKMAEKEAEAEGIRLKMMAEAEGIRLKMMAEAEGFQKQVDAMNSADSNFMTIKLIEKLPEIYKNLSPEHMVVMGEGNDGFNSLLQSFLPLMQILPEFQNQIKNQGSGKNTRIEKSSKIEHLLSPRSLKNASKAEAKKT